MITHDSNGQRLSQDFISAVAQPAINYRAELWCDGARVDASLMSFVLTLGAGTSLDSTVKRFRLGSIYSTQLTARLTGLSQVLIGKAVEVRIGVKIADSYTFVTVATVTVVSVEGFGGRSVLRASGMASRLESLVADGLSSGLYPLEQIAPMVRRVTGGGFSVSPNFDVEQFVYVEQGEPLSETLARCARWNGGFVCERPNGALALVPYGRLETYRIPSDFVTKTPTVAEADWDFSGLTLKNSEGTYTYGTGLVEVEDSLMDQITADYVYTYMSDYSYRPAELHVALLDPRITVEDVLGWEIEGRVVHVPAIGIRAEFSGGYSADISAGGLTLLASESTPRGKIATTAESAQRAAREAGEVAKATAQFFWHDGEGAHVGTVPEAATLGPNSLWNSLGMLIRDGARNLMAVTRSAVSFFDGLGNGHENVVASFRSDGVTIGRENEVHSDFGSNRLIIFGKYGDPFFSAIEVDTGDGVYQSFKLGDANPNMPAGPYSISSGNYCATSGAASVAMGDHCAASGAASVAMGEHCAASGAASVAMGDHCVAWSGAVFGRWNRGVDAALVVGNGTEDVHSNALVCDWDGNVRARSFDGRGALGESDNGGLFFPRTAEPPNVPQNSLGIFDVHGIPMTSQNSFSIIRGTSVTLMASAPAGSTVYKLENSYVNRLIAVALATGGYIALDRNGGIAGNVQKIISVLRNGQAVTPDSSAVGGNPIEITVAESINKDAATSSIFGYSAGIGGNVSLVIGEMCSITSGRVSCVLVGRALTAATNYVVQVGQYLYGSGSNSILVGHSCINRATRSIVCGTGHETVAAASNVAVFGIYSATDANTAFAVGNGTSISARKNAFIVDKSGKATAGAGFAVGAQSGASGSFTTADGKTVTVVGGIITDIS